jgi:hypothetical protein
MKFREPDSMPFNYHEKVGEMKLMAIKAEAWGIKAHADTNHFYDHYLPYEHHLRMTVQFAKDFFWLFTELEFWTLITALWLHDTIEDVRKNYNDILKNFNKEVAEIVRAVTNYGRGRDRDERMPDWLYEEISAIFLATATKICDRGANTQYSYMFGSNMFNKYAREDKKFRTKLLTEANIRLQPMFDHVSEIYNSPKNSFK